MTTSQPHFQPLPQTLYLFFLPTAQNEQRQQTYQNKAKNHGKEQFKESIMHHARHHLANDKTSRSSHNTRAEQMLKIFFYRNPGFLTGHRNPYKNQHYFLYNNTMEQTLRRKTHPEQQKPQ